MIHILKTYLLVIFILILSHHSFSQNTEYQFDYYTTYENLDYNQDSIVVSTNYNFSNSKNGSYLLKVFEKKDSIRNIVLYDYLNNVVHNFKNIKGSNILKDLSNLSYIDSRYLNMEYYKKTKTSFYKVMYSQEEGKKKIHIQRFKNKRQKKLYDESYYVTVPTSITNIQKYNFHWFATPLWSEKFELDTEDAIDHAVFIKNQKKVTEAKLLEIGSINFSMIIESNKVKFN